MVRFIASGQALDPAEVQSLVWDETHVIARITEESKLAGLDPYPIIETVRCETAGTFDPSIQSYARYKRDNERWGVKAGERELSFGLAQIHLPDNPEVTVEEATDPEFAIQFIVNGFKSGQRGRWTCYRNLFEV